MKNSLLKLTMLLCSVLVASCTDPATTTTETSQLKGSIYYSTANVVYRLHLSDQIKTELFSNARHPDIMADGRILAVETYPDTRIVYSDRTGATRDALITSEGYMGPEHKEYLNKPHISKDQRYVVYEGDNVYNPQSYVIDALSGSLIAKIGDYDARQPMISPSWAPDGSVVVQGWISLNNGIYRVSSDFKTITRIDPNFSNVSEPRVSPDGKTVAFIRDGKVWTMGIDGLNPTQYYVSGMNFSVPTWSPDGQYIAALSSGHIHVFDVAKRTVTEMSAVHYVGEDSQLCWVY